MTAPVRGPASSSMGDVNDRRVKQASFSYADASAQTNPGLRGPARPILTLLDAA